MNEQNKGLIELVIASLLFGLMPVIVRYGRGIGDYNITFFRVMFCALSIMAFALIAKMRIAPLKHEIKKMIIFGVLHGFIILSYVIAVNLIPIASAVLLVYSSPIWIALFSRVILKEKISRRTISALAIAIAGVVLVLFPDKSFLQGNFTGYLCALGTGLFMGLIYVMSKTFKSYDKVSLTLWQNIIALPFIFPLLFINFPKFTVFNFSVLLLLGAVFTAMPFILIFKGFAKMPASRGSIIITTEAIFAVAFAFVFFKEIPSITTLFGGVLIIIANYVNAG